MYHVSDVACSGFMLLMYVSRVRTYVSIVFLASTCTKTEQKLLKGMPVTKYVIYISCV
jgi:hypothetical protein